MANKNKTKDYGEYGRHYFNNIELKRRAISRWGDNENAIAFQLAELFNEAYMKSNNEYPGRGGNRFHYKSIVEWISPRKDRGYGRPGNVEELEALAEVFDVEPTVLLCDGIDPENIEIKQLDIFSEELDALQILRKVVLSYEKSDGYYLFPGVESENDAYLNWIDLIDERVRALINKETDDKELLHTRMLLCDSLIQFISKAEYADGLPEFITNNNPDLLHFTSAYRIANTNLKLFATCGLKFKHFPEKVEDLIAMRAHFADLNEDEIDNLFMVELSDTIKNIYEPQKK